MKKIGDGVFEAWVSAEEPIEETRYKYRFYTDSGCFTEPDPYAVYSQFGNDDASIVYFGGYEWGDGDWMKRRRIECVREKPLNIYEIHLGSWRTRDGRSYGGSDSSLNYKDIAPQLVGYASDMGYTHVCLLNAVEKRSPFSPTAKHGRPDEFKLFVDTLHRSGIGVILELEGEICRDYWTEEFHVDGFFVNEKELFLLGESFLIDCNWRRTVMDYLEYDVKHKKYKYAAINRALTEDFEKARVLSVLHSDVSGGKGTLFEKMQGDFEEKFARLRLFYGFMMLHPGKKMTFMGCELGEKKEWSEDEPVEWFLLDCEANAGFKRFVRDANRIYLQTKALWDKDFSWKHFEWISPLTPENDVMMFSRSSSDGDTIIAILNFGNDERRLPLDRDFDVLLNSDIAEYGGKGRELVREDGINISPLSAVVIKKKTAFFEKTIDYSTDV